MYNVTGRFIDLFFNNILLKTKHYGFGNNMYNTLRYVIVICV